MVWVRGIVSVLKFLSILGVVEYVVPGLGKEVGHLIGEVIGEELHK
jgi:hypothetical protein